MTDRIQVVVRIRPMQGQERRNGDEVVAKPVPGAKEVQLKVGPMDAQLFPCRFCFGRETSQEAFFDDSGIVELLDMALTGQKACAFAFGQTGAGKTYTMIGANTKVVSATDANSGMLGRSIAYLFDKLKDQEFSIRLACYEIYHEAVYDLLCDGKEGRNTTLPIRENAEGGFCVPDITTYECLSVKSAFKTVTTAIKARRVGSHDLNSRSNRSHCVTEIHIDVRGGGSTTTSRRKGMMTLVDLAGSERLKSTNSKGKVLQEAGFINKSLYTLGKVIAGLVRTGGDLTSKDVPYRDSKLTRLLIGSLGAGSRTLLVASISEASSSHAETTRTLKFSMSAARLSVKPIRFLSDQEKLVEDLRKQVKKLRTENKRLKKTIKSGTGTGSLAEMSVTGEETTAGQIIDDSGSTQGYSLSFSKTDTNQGDTSSVHTGPVDKMAKTIGSPTAYSAPASEPAVAPSPEYAPIASSSSSSSFGGGRGKLNLLGKKKYTTATATAEPEPQPDPQPDPSGDSDRVAPRAPSATATQPETKVRQQYQSPVKHSPVRQSPGQYASPVKQSPIRERKSPNSYVDRMEGHEEEDDYGSVNSKYQPVLGAGTDMGRAKKKKKSKAAKYSHEEYAAALKQAQDEMSMVSGHSHFGLARGGGSVVSDIMHDQYAHQARGGLAAVEIVSSSVLNSKSRRPAGGDYFQNKKKSKAKFAKLEADRALAQREYEIMRMERENIEKMLRMEELERRLAKLEQASPEMVPAAAAPAANADDEEDQGEDDYDDHGYGDDDFEDFEDDDDDGGDDVPWDTKRTRKDIAKERPKKKKKKKKSSLHEPSSRQKVAATKDARNKENDVNGNPNNQNKLKAGHKRLPKVSPYVAHQRKFGHIAEREHKKAMALAVQPLDRSQPIRVKQSHTEVTAMAMRGGATLTREEEKELKVRLAPH